MLRAHEWHRQQSRKVTGVPFVTHLWMVAGMVAEMGGNEDEVIAALLHDAAEDQGGSETLDAIGREFGAEVAELVLACSDTLVSPKPPWRERKKTHLAQLREANPSVLRIKLADKIHNSLCIVRDARGRGRHAFDSFQGGVDGTIWYFEEMLAIFRARLPSPWTEELAAIVNEMKRLARQS